MAIQVDPNRATPPSRQLVEAVLERIAAGIWGPGERLPSVRKLAAEALVNPNTVSKAYRELESLGAVAGRSGSGVYVTPEGPRKARADRHTATLVALENAIEAALRSGHDAEELSARVAALLRNGNGKHAVSHANGSNGDVR